MGDVWSQSCAASMSARSCRCVQGATGAAGGGSARLMSLGQERAVKGGRRNLSITQELRRYAQPSLCPSTRSDAGLHRSQVETIGSF